MELGDDLPSGVTHLQARLDPTKAERDEVRLDEVADGLHVVGHLHQTDQLVGIGVAQRLPPDQAEVGDDVPVESIDLVVHRLQLGQF